MLRRQGRQRADRPDWRPGCRTLRERARRPVCRDPAGPRRAGGALGRARSRGRVEFTAWTTEGRCVIRCSGGYPYDKRADEAVADKGRWSPSGARDPSVSQCRRRRPATDRCPTWHKVLYPEAGLHQGRGHRLLHPDRARSCCRTLADRPLTIKRYPNGVEEQVLLREERAARARRLGAHGDAAGAGLDEEPRHDRLRRGRRPADTRVAGEPGRARAARAAVGGADARPQAADRPDRVRPRPRSARHHRRVLRGGAARCATVLADDGLTAVREDVRLEGHAGQRADRGRRPGPAVAATRTRSPSSSSSDASRTGRVPDDEVAAPGQGVRRLEPEQPGQDDGRALLAARARRSRRCRHRSRGTRSSPAIRCASPPTTCSPAWTSTATCSPERSTTNCATRITAAMATRG